MNIKYKLNKIKINKIFDVSEYESKFVAKNVELPSETLLKRALETGRGVIFLTAHFGEYKFLPMVLALRGYPTSILSSYISLKKYFEAVDLDVINVSEGNSMMAVLKALKKGRIFITICDEFGVWRLDPTITHTFLAVPLPVDRSLDILCKRSGSEVLFGLIMQKGMKNYNLALSQLKKEPNDAPLAIQAFKLLQEAIYSDPDRWHHWDEFAKILFLILPRIR
jgi:Kdo2-lipid IVA lauroyltransferase/acyltransferase